MKKLYFLVIPALVFCLIACKKDGNKQVQTAIVGKWNLQKQNISQYIDGVKQPDISASTSDKAISYVKFNNDGTFSAVSLYNSDGIGNTTSLTAVIAVDTLGGTYSRSGQMLDLSLVGLGTLSAPDVIFSTGGSIPVNHLLSKSAQIMELTTSVLTLHTEYTVTTEIGSKTTTYKSLLDYYYTK